jgi:hypothetical protein
MDKKGGSHALSTPPGGAVVPLPENPDLMRLFDEFMEIGLSLDMFREDRKFEGGSNGDRRTAERASHPMSVRSGS